MEQIIVILLLGAIIGVVKWVYKEYIADTKGSDAVVNVDEKSTDNQTFNTQQNKKIMFGVPVEQINSHDPTNLITYLQELEQNKGKEYRGAVQVFGNSIFDSDEKLLASQDFCIWAGGLLLNYPKFAFFLKPESIFLVITADLVGSGLYHISKEKKIETLDTILPDCIELGIKKGYTRTEMEDYYKNLFDLIP